MRLKVLDIVDVAERQLCCGCGACASAFPDSIEMIDVADFGRRPRLRQSAPQNGAAREALEVCPGFGLAHDKRDFSSRTMRELRPGWGPVIKLWEGAAADEEIRWAGSSGGAASALALYCLEECGMSGVLHIGPRRDIPYLNETVLSTTRAELLARTGSRYAPASPADRLDLIEQADGPCVFIGKPCDVAAVQKLRKMRPELDRKLGLTIAFFCAGTPSTQATLELMRRAGINDPSTVRSVRYRGNGWPGRFTVEFDTASGPRTVSLSYDESWGFLEEYRQWRCYICPDHTGEFADIAVGDPWYRPIEEGESGSSLILARSERGCDIVERAIRAGRIDAHAVQPDLLEQSQPQLLGTRGSLAGRLLVLGLTGTPRPRFRGFPMWRFWLTRLTMKQKMQSLLGTIKRIFRKRLRSRVPMIEFEPPISEAAGLQSRGFAPASVETH